MIHLLRWGGDGVQPLLQQMHAGGQILGRELLGKGFQIPLELIEQLGIIGSHTGQFAIGRMHAGQDPHLVEGILLILLIGLPELDRFHAVVVQGKGLLQITEFGGGFGAALIDLVDAAVKPRTDVGVERLKWKVERGVDQRHLVTTG
ncbi:hypothetical protein D3C79_779930 [compost metagenome]